MAERIFAREMQLVPDVLGRRWSKSCGRNLLQALGLVPPSVPTAPTSTLRKCSVRATCQPPEMPARRPAPVVRRKPRSGPADLASHFDDHRGRHAALGLGELRREAGVFGLEAGR